MQPLVSALIVNRNYGKYLGQAIKSILAQDYPKEYIEIIVVDYGSTDGSQRIIQEFGADVRGFYLEDGTFLQAINAALANANGKYIAFIGADDMWLPTKISRQVAFLEHHPEVGLVYSDMVLISDDGQVISDSYWNLYSIKPRRGRVAFSLAKENFISGGTILVRSELRDIFFPIPEGKGFDRTEDWWIAFNVSLHSEVDFVDEPLTLYRFHGSNVVLANAVVPVTFESTKLKLMQEVLIRKTMLERLSELEVYDDSIFRELNLLYESKECELKVFESLEKDASSLIKMLTELGLNSSTARSLVKGVMLKITPGLYNQLRFLRNRKSFRYNESHIHKQIAGI